MFKSRIPVWCDPVAFRCCLLRLLAAVGMCLFVAIVPVQASDTDDRYFQIYGVIEQADALHKAGHVEKAKAKYLEADKGLKELRQFHPSYNSKLVAARLSYLSEKIALLSRPPAPAAPTNETAVAAAGKTALPGQPLVTLLEAGNEPRQVLRFQGKPLDKQIVTMTAKIGTTISAPEMPGEMMKLPMLKFKAVLTTKDVAADQSTNYELMIEEAEVVAEPGAAPQLVEGMKQSLVAVKGLVVVGSVTDRYLTKKVEAQIPPGTDAQTREAMEQTKNRFFMWRTVIPEEAIGLGAKWEVKEKIKSQGMTIDQTTRHELVSQEDGRLTVKSYTTQSATNQKIPNPIMPTLKVDLTKMSGTVTSTATVDLARVLPGKATSDERSEMNLSLNAGGKKQVMTMKLETLSALESE